MVRRVVGGGASVIIIVLVLLAACRPSAGYLLNENGDIECGGDGQAIALVNNPDAADPTFAELAAFIEQDATDKKEYVDDAYVCADFAEEVHNNAEAAGIRAAWVGITFFGTDDGHAVNAFETTDKGLVYIDCTNGNAPEDRDGEIKSWDTVAYVEKGEKYGIIPIEIVAGSKFDYYPFGYDFYTDYERKWREYEALLDAHNEAVDKYNRDIGGRVFTYGTPAARRIAEREQELQAQEETITALETELGGTWYESEFSSYTIKEVLVHW